jgi:hypothetical protein
MGELRSGGKRSRGSRPIGFQVSVHVSAVPFRSHLLLRSPPSHANGTAPRRVHKRRQLWGWGLGVLAFRFAPFSLLPFRWGFHSPHTAAAAAGSGASGAQDPSKLRQRAVGDCWEGWLVLRASTSGSSAGVGGDQTPKVQHSLRHRSSAS